MPSNRDPQEPQDPMEDDDLVGAGEDDAEEAEDEADDEEEDDDILDEEDDDEIDEEDEDEVEEETEDESIAKREAVTGEVGSEGGSPGETMVQRRGRSGMGRGSEATTTWEGGMDATHELRNDEGVPVKRAP